MQRSTANLLRLSAAVAVGLWLLATLAETLFRPEPSRLAPASVPDRSADRPRPASAPPVPASCPEVEDNLEALVDEAGSCSTDDECTLFDYGYPLDCMSSVAKAAVPGLRTAYRQYDQSCEHRLFYDCPTEPFVRVPVCRDNRCTVELFRQGDPQGRVLQPDDER